MKFIIILNFHGIGKAIRPLLLGEEKVWIETATFEEMIDAVRERSNVRITFDDGNISDLEIAIPALKKRGLKAMFFITAGLLDNHGYLSRSQVWELMAEGMEVGSHGLLHRNWRNLNDKELYQELVDARANLEDLCGKPVKNAAIPFGSYDRRVLRKLRETNYEHVYTSDGGLANPSKWLQPRNSIRSFGGVEELSKVLDVSPFSKDAIIRNLKSLIKRWR